MNKARREALCKVTEILQQAQEDLESLRDEEQEYYDNMPESLQAGGKGQAVEESVAQIDDAIESIDIAVNAVCISIDM